MNPVKAQVFRFDPETDDKPRYMEYVVDIAEETYVIVLLDRIQREIDASLSFRSYCCGLQACGSCRVQINKVKSFACLMTVKPGDEVTIDPLTFPENHIKDLVIELK